MAIKVESICCLFEKLHPQMDFTQKVKLQVVLEAGEQVGASPAVVHLLFDIYEKSYKLIQCPTAELGHLLAGDLLYHQSFYRQVDDLVSLIDFEREELEFIKSLDFETISCRINQQTGVCCVVLYCRQTHQRFEMHFEFSPQIEEYPTINGQTHYTRLHKYLIAKARQVAQEKHQTHNLGSIACH